MPGTVVITGASSGFGEAFALAFGRLGHPLVLGARRTDRLAKVAEAARKAGSPRAIALPLDVRVRESIHKFAVAAELETPEILINNAGGALGRAPVAEVEDDDLVGMIEANLTGLLRMTRELLPGLIRRKKGHVINISSLAAHGVYEGGGVYAPVKHAVRAVSQALRLELSGTDVRVTDVAPGMAETEFSVVRLGSEEKAKSVYAGMRPLTAQDVSDVVVWAATRPPHVNISEVVLTPTDQAGLTKVHRR
ncbi:MAG: SDR family NAD(P)-dependent oxidoreductase [Deltaproteobacteria bacterium]|nr:MAG: SDR family NAD(P)-dependent oxidoreductase [Deltaproteobacteria bacterium]TMB29229.1 MAG: SDR family NAD(P)-dependent oxidoreductase [Deltaproteobacteria bacterium]